MAESNPQNKQEEQQVTSTENNQAEKVEVLLTHELFEMESAKTDLESEGENQIAQANLLSGLDRESIREVQTGLGLQEKIAEISALAAELLENAKKAMKRTIVVGMAAVTITGCAGTKGTTDIDLSAFKAPKGENSGSTYAEKARDHVASITENPVYLQRLTMELDGNEEEAGRIQQERLQNIKEVQIKYFKDKESLKSESAEILRILGPAISGDNTPIAFTLVSEKGKDLIGLPEEENLTAAYHEISHVSNKYGLNMPQKTAERLQQLIQFNGENAGYFSIPTEVLARKQAIDAKMEYLGIKKYEESYTPEHFQTLLKYELDALGIKNTDEIDKLPPTTILPECIEFDILYGLENMVDLFNTTAHSEDASDAQDTATPVV